MRACPISDGVSRQAKLQGKFRHAESESPIVAEAEAEDG